MHVLEDHVKIIDDELQSHHITNQSEFYSYLVTLKQAIINLLSIMWISVDSNHVETTSDIHATDSEDIVNVLDQGSVTLSLYVGSVIT